MNEAALERIMASPELPTLPAVAVEVLEITLRQNVELADIARIVEYDPAIATRILRTVNSSYYGLPRRVGSIRQALAYLGMETVKGLLLGFSLARSIKGDDDVVTFDFLDYWRRSIFTAAAARRIATATKACDPEEAFMAGLVQDIGSVAMWRHYRDRYLQVMDMTGGDHSRLSTLERKFFGADHTSIGAAMLEGWMFPPSIIESVRMHHEDVSQRAFDEDLQRTLRLASMIADSICAGASEGQVALRDYTDRAAEWFGLRRSAALGLLQSISDHASELSQMFSLNTGNDADIDALLEEADQIRRTQKIATTNESTDIPNDPWRSLGERDEIDVIIRSTCEKHEDVGLILVGVDNMRDLNREAGTKTGDLAMRRAAESIVRACKEAAGESAEVYRFVGAEMAVVLRGPIANASITLAERIRVAVRLSPLSDESIGMRALTASIGVATMGPTSGPSTPDELVRAAMVALSEARRRGGDAVADSNDPEINERMAA